MPAPISRGARPPFDATPKDHSPRPVAHVRRRYHGSSTVYRARRELTSAESSRASAVGRLTRSIPRRLVSPGLPKKLISDRAKYRCAATGLFALLRRRIRSGRNEPGGRADRSGCETGSCDSLMFLLDNGRAPSAQSEEQANSPVRPACGEGRRELFPSARRACRLSRVLQLRSVFFIALIVVAPFAVAFIVQPSFREFAP